MSGWLDALLEATENDVDDIIEKATSGDAQGITDVNHASTEVLDGGASTDPNALNYDKTNLYSQDTPIGDENVAGTVARDIKTDTNTSVTSGNETKALESFFTPDELRGIYTEAVSEYICEKKDEIDKRYKSKVEVKVKEKAKKKADDVVKGKKKNQQFTTESAMQSFNDAFDAIVGQF